MDFLIKIKGIIKLIINTKFNWKIPKIKKILVYDYEGSDELLKYLPDKNTEILHVRRENLNIMIFFVSIIKYKISWTFSKYLRTYIEKVKPEFIITFIDNNPEFYKIKNYFPNSKTIFIQNGVRGYENDIFGIFFKKNENIKDLFVDEMFVWNEQTGINYKKYLKGNFNAIGSIKNNRIKVNKDKKKYEILFLSEYRKKTGFGKNYTWENYFSIEKKFIPYLYKFCQNKKIKLSICANTFNYEEEHSFYKDLINGKEWELLKRENEDSSYNYVDLSKAVIFISTALGYEAITRGAKVGAITVRSEATNIRSHKFGWPYVFTERNDKFWTNVFDENKFDEILNFILYDNKEYSDLISGTYKKILNYTPDNVILKKKFKELNIL